MIRGHIESQTCGECPRRSPHRWPRAAIVSSVAAVCLGLGPASLAQSPAAPTHYAAQIRWTAFGIPHVQAADFASLGFGVGYAFAQQNACLLFDSALTVRGERSRYLGPDERITTAFRPARNIDSDVFFRAYFDPDRLLQAYQKGPPEVLSMLQGYADGASRNLADRGLHQLPEACRDAPWIAKLTVKDVVLMLAAKATLLSGVTFLQAIVHAQPPDDTGASPAGHDSDQDPAAAPAEPNQGGSNAYALGRTLAAGGTGLLAGNPHFPWQGPSRFFEMHLTVPGKLDVMGASPLPFPVVTIGFNHDVAWSHTVSTAHQSTLFELRLVPGRPLEYLVDGQPEAMQRHTVTIAALAPDGTVKPVDRTIYETRYGPVVSLPRFGVTWTDDSAFAFADVERANTRGVEQWLRIDQAGSVAALGAALTDVHGTPWLNTIAADRKGDVFYADTSVVPNVTDTLLEDCKGSPAAETIARKTLVPVLDGSRSDCDWQLAAGQRQQGALPVGLMPKITRSDYVLNSNGSYWLANRQAPLTGYPSIVGLTDTPQNWRTRMGYKALDELIATKSGRVTPADLEAMLLDDRNYVAELIGDDLAKLCRTEPAAGGADANSEQAMQEACDTLTKWDRHDNVQSAGAAFFREFWRQARLTRKLWLRRFDRADPLHTPSGLNLADDTVRSELRRILVQTVHQFHKLGLAPSVKLAAVQRRPDRASAIPIPGGDEFEGVLNEIGPGQLASSGYLARSLEGSSYIQVVTWNGDVPVADALLTYSQSADETSPHYQDQTRRYVERQWVRLPFADGDIQADPSLVTQTVGQ